MDVHNKNISQPSTPTVSLNAFNDSCVIDAMENRKVVIIDIAVLFLQGDWPQNKYPG